MSLSTNVVRRGTRYYFRCRVPADLVARVGRTELNRSLKTSDPREARIKATAVAAGVERLWGAIRRALDKRQIEELVRDWLRGRLDQDQQQRIRTDFADDFARHNDMHPGQGAAYLIGTDAEAELERWQKAIKNHDWTIAQPYASSLVKELGLPIEKDSLEYKFLCQALTLASAQLHAIRANRSLGDWSDDPFLASLCSGQPLDLAPVETVKAALPGRDLRELVGRFLEEKQRLRNTSAKRLLDYRAALTLFEEWCGSSTPITTITRQMIGDFRTVLTKLPPNHTKRFRGKPINEVIELAESSGLTRLNPLTINSKYLTPLDAFFGWCQSGGEISNNPAAGVRVHLPRHRLEERGRNPFQIEHLQKIFQAPLYTGCKSSSRVYEPGDTLVRDHRYWLPLLGLWSGARLNELCQLRIADVRKVDSVWCLDINTVGAKKLKTKAAIRLVPIHPELKRLGFLKFVEQRRLSKSEKLWEGVEAGSTDYASDAVSKWFARFLRETIGAGERRAEKLAFHSFRHTMKDALRAAGVQDSVQDALLGHKEPMRRVPAGYGEGYKPPRLLKELSKVRYDGLDLSHLYVN